jgi:hypothetical protein
MYSWTLISLLQDFEFYLHYYFAMKNYCKRVSANKYCQRSTVLIAISNNEGEISINSKWPNAWLQFLLPTDSETHLVLVKCHTT